MTRYQLIFRESYAVLVCVAIVPNGFDRCVDLIELTDITDLRAEDLCDLLLFVDCLRYFFVWGDSCNSTARTVH
jgi:hypothetical protein